MIDGGIIVEGNADYGVEGIGLGMMGGTIIIKGDAGERVGYQMAGGKITVYGDLVCSPESRDRTIVGRGNPSILGCRSQ